MKNYIKIGLTIVLIMTLAKTNAQTNSKIKLNRGAIEPFKMEVTFDKTSHLIFPSAIRYVDLGSELLIASKAEDAENVLRIKAAQRAFDAETNFSVITEDGRFYNFDVHYSFDPGILSYDLSRMQKKHSYESADDVLFEEMGNHPASLAGLILETIYQKDKRIIKHIGSKSFGIQFVLKGIYIMEEKYYFHTELTNRTTVPFQIDFVNFKVVDKKIAKRTVSQEIPLIPLLTYKPITDVNIYEKDQNVFLLDQFTLANDKVLLIEIFERNGGRNQVLQVENADLIKARLINDMHLKFH